MEPEKKSRLRQMAGWAGVILASVPPALLLVTGLAGSLLSGRLLVDFLLPAELFALTLGGMALIAVGAAGRKPWGRVTALLPLGAAACLGLCQGLAWLTGIADGSRPARGGLWYLLLALLALYDLAALAAPAVGIAALRRRP